MWLLLLLFFPTIVLLAGFFIGRGKITWKEFLVEQGVVAIIVVAAYYAGRANAVSDKEIWNGWLTRSEYYEEWWERVSCRHPIPCTHYDKNGRPRHSNDGHYHTYDVDYNPPYWEAHTSMGETVRVSASYFERACAKFGNRVYEHITRFSKDHGPGNKYVTKYMQGKSMFVPVSTEHTYTNYLKASPDSVLRRTGQGDKFAKLIPAYPTVSGDLECPRVLLCGTGIADEASWNAELAAVNARLGAKKQVNILLVVVNTSDSSYVHALEEQWLGGKKNDLVVVIGCTAHPAIAWVAVMSWSKSEDLKVQLRDAVKDIGTLEKRAEIVGAIETMTGKKFVRTPMAEYEYLMASWQPSTLMIVLIMLLGVGASVGLTIYFVKEDPFGDRYGRGRLSGSGRSWDIRW